MLKEFREFIARGNLVELAVAFIMGVAFSGAVTAFTKVVLGTLSYVAGGDVSFDRFGVHRGRRIVIPYGTFLSAVVDLVVIALVLFFLVKAYNRFRRQPRETPSLRPCPYCRTDIAKDASRCPSCTSEVPAATSPGAS